VKITIIVTVTGLVLKEQVIWNSWHSTRLILIQIADTVAAAM
jgi:hypothetical protein